jgi:hypothetical protein
MKKWLLVLSGVLIVVIIFSNKRLMSGIFGEVQAHEFHLNPGKVKVPHQRSIDWQKHSSFADTIFNQWAGKPFSEKSFDGKGNVTRILLAKLLVKRDIPEVNKIIKRLTAWGVSGSSWALNKKGDYDFTITILTTILWFYGDQPDLLYPETKDYLLKVLLTEDGNKFRYTAPRTLGLVLETENHVLMTEGSRYLKNRWLINHGNSDPKFDNVLNGMEEKLLIFMEDMKTNGLYEFNSLPYIGYTITALLNLEAFASDKVRAEARNVLDYMNWCYALGSYQLKHYPPMRRRYEKSLFQEITTDYQSIFMKSWLSYSLVVDYNTNINGGEVHALMGACMPYRPADKVVELIFNKGKGYFVKIGHGPESCPEIYSAGNHFLLSAGGANQGKRSLIVARPITLFLNDNAKNLSETLHLAGPGTDFMKWNNTGVAENFACAAGPVIIPKSWVPASRNETWAVYSANDSLLIAVHSKAEFGLLALFKGGDADSLLSGLIKSNPDNDQLKSCFQFPGGRKLTYDVRAPKDKWVIISENGTEMERDFDRWPLIDGNLKN